MNKIQWYGAWRQYRIITSLLSKNVPLQSGNCLRILKELYGTMYTDKEQAGLNLVYKYKDKLDPKFLAFHAERVRVWRPRAELRASGVIRNLVYSDNPFLKLIPKSEWSGSCVPIPIKYDNPEES